MLSPSLVLGDLELESTPASIANSDTAPLSSPESLYRQAASSPATSATQVIAEHPRFTPTICQPFERHRPKTSSSQSLLKLAPNDPMTPPSPSLLEITPVGPISPPSRSPTKRTHFTPLAAFALTKTTTWAHANQLASLHPSRKLSVWPPPTQPVPPNVHSSRFTIYPPLQKFYPPVHPRFFGPGPAHVNFALPLFISLI
ncbi:hypothetical protein EDB86DRAFT_2912261 [Lactarius hatsudake]|nr:hypothetical protein EDB86DRAFT_2912261 [Lactarius hatsudake]